MLKRSPLTVIFEASNVPVTVALVTLRLVAIIAPVIVALVAVNAPLRPTLKGALAKVLFPRCIPLAVDKEILVVFAPAIKEVEPTVKPPILPVVADISPAISKSEPSNFK